MVKTVLPMQGTQVQFLVRERTMQHGAAKKKKNNKVEILELY